MVGLRETWGLALANPSTQVLALTVPEAAGLDARALNAAILGHAAPRYHAFDLAAALPLHSLSGEERQRWWDDGVHPTPAGYARMGEAVGDALVRLLKEG
jgi:lysophospholipase L1-like esterase